MKNFSAPTEYAALDANCFQRQSREKLRRFFIAALLFAFCFSFGDLLHAIPLGRLRRITPVVRKQRAKTSNWVVARERDAVTYGDTIRTGAKGKADVLFANGTKVAMRGGTSIQIIAPASANAPLVIRLFGALSEVFVRPKGNTQIRTAAAIAAARGTQYLVRLTDDNTTEVVVTEGSVDFSNEKGAVLVEANQRSSAQVGSAPSVPVAVDASGELRWTADVTQLPLEWETPFRFADAKNARIALKAAQREAANAPQNLAAQQRLGEAFYDAIEYSNAIAQFERALQIEPNNVSLLLALSRANRARGDGDAALEIANRAREIAPENADAKLEIALSQLVRNDENAARTALTSIEDTPNAQTALGLMSLRRGDSFDAEKHFRAALKSNASSFQARAFLALSLLTQNHAKEAEIEARKAAETQPLSSQTQGVLSLVLFFQGRLDEAESASRRAVNANQDSPFALLTQGRLFLAQNRLDDAHDALARAQSLAPQLPIVAVELGETYLRLGNLPKAEANFRAALAQNGEMAMARSGLGRVLELRGENAAAEREMVRATQLDAADSSIRARLVTFYIARGELEKAQSSLPLQLAPTPENALLLARLSELNLFRQDLTTALEFARRAVILRPDSSVAHYQLGRVYLEQDRTFQAEQQFRQAAILDRKNAQARFALGTIREKIESGRDFSRASSLLSEANLGGAFRGLSLQNLQTPGAEDRIQAALQDPTIARIATRSYGDTQIDGLLGTKSQQYGAVSFLRESNDKSSLFGVNAFHDKRDGATSNSDQMTDRAGVMLGVKSKNNPSGLFFQAQFERVDQGLNTDNFSDFALNARERINKPTVLFGGNLQRNADSSTRFLSQWNRLDNEGKGYARDSSQTEDAQSLAFELRHDRQLNARNYFSAGLSSGRVRRDSNFFFGAFPPFLPAQRFIFKSRIRSTDAYIRDEFDATKRLRLTGEVQVKKLDANSTLQFIEPVVLPPSLIEISNKTFVLPKVVLDYRMDDDTNVRLRLRRALGAVSDFDLLKPTDLFTSPTSDLPQLSTGNLGNFIELEADHTFRNSSFLRFNVFQQQLRNAQEPAADKSAGELVPRARLRGVRASYEGLLGRDTTFYLNATLNDAQDQTRNRDISFVPRFIGEAGLQYLNRDGWFVQPSYVYQSARFVPLASGVGREKRPGFGLFNLRVGKRSGLKSVFYVEVVDAFDQEYDILGVQQPGRQFRIGASQRF